MKKLILLSLLFIFSCGTRKTDISKTDNLTIKNTYLEGSKIVLGNNFTYKPFNPLKPMVIEGKTFNNAIVSNDKSRTIIKWKYGNITKTITLYKTKVTTRTNHDFLYLGMFLIVVCAVFIWFKTGK